MIGLIGLGGSIGAAVRFLIGNFMQRKAQRLYPFPIGTWLINITGSFLLGLITNLYLASQINDALWYILGIGFCGAYTTFSTFGNETLTLIQSNEFKQASIYVCTSVIFGGIAAMFGLVIPI